jgi:WD40 repeat protein
MKKFQLWLIIAGIEFAAVGRGQRNELAVSTGYRYSAAFISTTGTAGHAELVIFPLRGKALKIPIRSAGGPFSYGPDGKTLYGQCTPDPVGPRDPVKIALCKIELKTVTKTAVSGSTGLYARDFAISNQRDRIFVSGNRRDGDKWGLFEIAIPGGAMRQVLQQSGKGPKSSLGHLSISPDGRRAVATRNGRVELIDLPDGTATPLGDKLFIAAWSPNGKWLAAVEKGEQGRTILMDAKTLTRQRTLGPSELDWSPDSRYLLGFKPCGPYSGTLEAIDVESGERTTIESSECQVNQATTGWVSNEVYEN